MKIDTDVCIHSSASSSKQTCFLSKAVPQGNRSTRQVVVFTLNQAVRYEACGTKKGHMWDKERALFDLFITNIAGK